MYKRQVKQHKDKSSAPTTLATFGFNPLISSLTVFTKCVGLADVFQLLCVSRQHQNVVLCYASQSESTQQEKIVTQPVFFRLAHYFSKLVLRVSFFLAQLITLEISP